MNECNNEMTIPVTLSKKEQQAKHIITRSYLYAFLKAIYIAGDHFSLPHI